MLALYVGLPFLCVAAVRPNGRSADRVVLGLALYEGVLLGLGLALGTARALTPPVYRAALIVVALALSFKAWRVVRARPGRPLALRRWLLTRRGALAAALTIVVLGVCLAQAAMDAVVGSLHWDGISYHLPRVIAWRRQGHFDAWPGATWHEVGLPVGADVVLGTKILLGTGVHGVAYVALVLTLGAMVAVYSVARALGLSPWRAVVAALLFASFPVVGSRVGASSSDIAAAFPVLAGSLALVRLGRPVRAWTSFLLLAALGVACKPTVLPFVILVTIGACWRKPGLVEARTLRSPATWSAAVGGTLLVVASYLPVYRAFGDLTGGEIGRMHRVESLHDVGTALGAATLHWVLEPVGYLPRAARPTWISDTVGRAYRGIGLSTTEWAEMQDHWQPGAGPDTGSTGILLALLAPVAFLVLPRRGRVVCAALWMAGYTTLFGVMRAQPFAGRFGVVLFAGLAVACAAGRLARTRAFVALVALNVMLMVPLWWWSTAVSLALRSEGGELDVLARDRGLAELRPTPPGILRVMVPIDRLLGRKVPGS